jgi:hypothetical protein
MPRTTHASTSLSYRYHRAEGPQGQDRSGTAADGGEGPGRAARGRRGGRGFRRRRNCSSSARSGPRRRWPGVAASPTTKWSPRWWRCAGTVGLGQRYGSAERARRPRAARFAAVGPMRSRCSAPTASPQARGQDCHGLSRGQLALRLRLTATSAEVWVLFGVDRLFGSLLEKFFERSPMSCQAARKVKPSGKQVVEEIITPGRSLPPMSGLVIAGCSSRYDDRARLQVEYSGRALS